MKSEDTDPTPLKGGTEPGLGPKRPNGAAAPVKEEPAPVDFDALNAALGDLPQPKASIPPKAASESEGRSSATYASARPHTIPPAHEPSDLDAPAVIVATDDTVPSAPPKMTTPLAAAGIGPGSGEHRVPSSGNQPAAAKAQQASYPFTPQPFPVQRGVVQPTMKMPDRPRRPRSPTVVVRPRGPSKVQKLVVFAAMLVLFLAFATAVAIWRQPGWFGLDGPAPAATPTINLPSYSAAVASLSAMTPPPPPPTASTAPSASTSTPPPPSTSTSTSTPAKPSSKKAPLGK